MAGGERLNGLPHVRLRVVGGSFLLFPHLAPPFSALDFVNKAEAIREVATRETKTFPPNTGGISFEDF